MFHLYTNVLSPDKTYADFEALDALREELLDSPDSLLFTDYGAGGEKQAQRKRKVSDIAALAAKPPQLARLLYRLAEEAQAGTIVELGTSLGLSTLHLALPKPDAAVITFEGCPETAKAAKANFAKFKRNNIQVITGNIDETLAPALKQIQQIDLAFLDANHREEPTIRYFNLLAEKRTEQSMFILDDIHWSPGMERAWEKIKADPRVSLSADLFWMGIVFFRSGVVKQDFVFKI
ncbi:MAG: class I SAM-dependent methyltransferase [Bacteroidota bacterium]